MEVEQLRQRSHSKNQCIPYTAPFTASQQYKHNYTANMLCQCYIMATGDTLQMMLLHKKAAAVVIQICNLFTSTVDGSIAALSTSCSTICTVHNDSHTHFSLPSSRYLSPLSSVQLYLWLCGTCHTKQLGITAVGHQMRSRQTNKHTICTVHRARHKHFTLPDGCDYSKGRSIQFVYVNIYQILQSCIISRYKS